MMINEQQLLREGMQALGVTVDEDALMEYLTLLGKWNKTYNLTAIKTLQAMVSKHLLDSLAITPHVTGQRIIDVGTGAGLPGIPLALALPEKHFTLLDSNGKKTRFLTHVKRSLKLDNVEIMQSRAENYHPKPNFDTVVSRAFASIDQMIAWTQHLLSPQGYWLAMKGKGEAISQNYPHSCYPLSIPGLSEERCVIIIKNTKENDRD